MTDRWLNLSLVITGLALLAVQVSIVESPDPKQIRQMVGQNQEQFAWVGRVAPNLTVPMLDGSSFRVADHVGQRVVVLNFFATWCGPCRAEMPELQRYTQSLAAAKMPFTFVAIDVEEKRSTVEKFLVELKLAGMPIGLDESGDLAKHFAVNAYPTTVVIGADGLVKLYETGGISNADVSLTPTITPEFEAIRQGHGISRELYVTAAAREDPLIQLQMKQRDQVKTPEAPEPPLDARARHIADTMTCPCGCDDTVSHCSCHTAKGVKAKLAAGGFEKQTDAEVKTALNHEFCMKGM
jgi:thiol-disulfide isomerase/thioredoxin